MERRVESATASKTRSRVWRSSAWGIYSDDQLAGRSSTVWLNIEQTGALCQAKLRLFVAEGDGGIDPAGAEGGNGGCGEHGQGEQGDDGGEGEGVGRGDLVQIGGEGAAEKDSAAESGGDARGSPGEGLPEHEAHDARTGGTQGDADAHFPGALLDGIGREAVEP